MKKSIILIVTVGSLLATCVGAATGRQTPGGLVPEAVSSLQPVGRLDGAQRMHLAIGLAPRDQHGMDAFIQQLYDPASPNYRHYLNQEQFTARFGPSERDYQTLIDYAKAHRFKVTRQYPNRVVLDVEGAVADIEKALHVTMRTYPHPTEARTFYSPDVEPSLDVGVSIAHIGGLDNFTRPHPKHRHHAVNGGAKATSKEGSAPGGQLWGNDFRDAYVPGTPLTGTGQNLGLLEFEGFYARDITDYENAIGMSASTRPQLVVVSLDGGATPEDGADNGEECSLDIEIAVSMAPGLSHVYVFEDGSSASGNVPFDDVFESMLTYTNVLQFSCSWGGDTTKDPTSETLFKEMATQGQSFFDASGDNGAFVGAVEFPSDSPSITQVGGTTLSDGGGPSYPWESEVVWDPESGPNVSGDSAESSSGGISTYYAIPYWQTNISMTANLGSKTMRNIPDVAGNADNCYLYTDDGQAGGGWGGTSCAAPLWAGFAALINQQAAASGTPPVGFLNPALYALASGANYASYFHDITSGNNTWRASPSRFYAVPGYDLCCGLGTMNGMALINALVVPPPVFLPRAKGYTLSPSDPCGSNEVYPGETVTIHLAFQNDGSAASTNLVITLLASNGAVFPSGPQTIGVLHSEASSTNTFSFFADGSCGQTITAVLQFQDGEVDDGTVSYSFQLGLPFSTTNYGQNFDGVSAGNLPSGWTTSSTGGLTAWTTVNSSNDGTTNVAYCPDAATQGEVYLYSPEISLNEGTNQLSFLNDYNLEETYDGGVLEIAIGDDNIANGAFQDILAAGGSFVTGGYLTAITDAGDPMGQQSPLIGRQAWTGDSGGVITTIVNLPATASAMHIQLRWICGTDDGNDNLVGIGGWWIDDIVIGQNGFDCSGCRAPNIPVPTIVFPTKGSQISTISPVVVVTGLAPEANSTVIISNNGVADVSASTDENAVYAAPAVLTFGTNVLTVTQGKTNSSSNVSVTLLLGAPILDVPPVANTNAALSGRGAPGATVTANVYAGDSATGTPMESFVVVVDASGNFSRSIILPLGDFTVTGTETIDGQTSTNSDPVSVSVVPVPPPTIISPIDGLTMNEEALTIRGKGVAGATVSISNIINGVTTNLATTTVSHAGGYSVVTKLADGINTLFAVQAKNDITSPPSALVTVNDYYLAPVILAQPADQTNFLKGSVTFSAEVVGAAPLHIIWTKRTLGTTNVVKIPGAVGLTYTLSNLKTNDTNFSYGLIASNKYGVATNRGATLTLVSNPFTADLTGAYYGLFAESNAQFESSGLLTLNLTSLGKFTARILNAGGSYSFSGGLSGVGWWSNLVSRGAGNIPLAVTLNLDVSNDAQPMLGTVSAGTNWTAALEADRATYSAANPFTNQGKYTLIFGSTNTDAQSPGGDGYATASASAEGMISLRGVLSDNTSVAPAAVSVSQDGRWPLYIPLYGKYGSLAGWITFTNQGPSVIDLTNSNSGPCSFAGPNVMWFRTNADGKLYTNGFAEALSVIGSSFLQENNAGLLDSPGLEVMVSGGGLTGVLSNSVDGSASGKFTSVGGDISGLTLSLAPATGVIKGSFSDPAAATGVEPIKGVVFQAQTNAAGFFIGAGGRGSFILTQP
ncbi:MAG: protease pro-enzyme activation domain-containing protein [Verrucomicrobiota bacterium]